MISADSQLVVVGSSAGGIETLSRLVASFPVDFPAPIVIAQHLDPRRPSHLQEILARHATLPVRSVEERDALAAGVIFVVPANRVVEIADREVRLREATIGAVAPSIDGLFESAAEAYGAGVIAVVLTGSGSDGSAGAWHVKQAGGSVVIENPLTAKFPSMPRSIPTALVDATADIDAIAGVLSEILANGISLLQGEEKEFRSLIELIHERNGIDFGSYKPATIMRRLQSRMNATSHQTLVEYIAYLETNPGEYANLVNSLLIKVTEFFRDPPLFEYLRDEVLPGIIAEARREKREVRLWSAGCSTGEEAYSLAIIVSEALGDDLPWPDVRIFGTDVDREAVAFGRRGIYAPSALKSLPTELRDKYLEKAENGYGISKRLRGMVVFGEHDLGERVPFPRIDLLLCRNVLIYFTRPMQRIALETFAFSLRSGGRLAIGLSETVAALPGPFEDENAHLRVYRRLPGAHSIPPMRHQVARPRRNQDYQLDQAIRGTHRDVQRVAESSALANSLLLNLAVGVVVVDPRYYIVRVNSSARKMLGLHGTAFDQDFIHLAEVLPPGAIRAAIDSALIGNTTTTVFEVEPTDAASETTRFVEAKIRPYRVESRAVEGAVIELTDVTKLEQERRADTRTQQRLGKAVTTNSRLLRANEELTTLVAELRMANEAMLLASEDSQSAREEVETVNEEFQATNEELETLNEELTASVEELRVANEDLAMRTNELSVQAKALELEKKGSQEERDRLRSILASLGDAVVAVDHDGLILTTNAAYDRMFGDVGDAILPEDAAGLPIPTADRPLQRASRGERFRMEFAVARPGATRHWFEAVAEPLTAEDRTWGGVIAIRDLSERTMRLSLERLMAAAGHELKTPVAALHGYLQLVQRHLGPESSEQARIYAARSLVQTRQIGELIERLFDVGRIQGGRLELMIAPLDLVAVVKDAVDVAGTLPHAQVITLSPDVESIPLRADAVRLEQVIVNLLSNAVEHAATSQTIEVTLCESGGMAVIEVRDHGKGIAPDQLPLLFKPYTRLGDDSSTGLGLGLYLAREIITAHGGTIEAKSKLDQGTTIIVRLPVGKSKVGRVAARQKVETPA